MSLTNFKLEMQVFFYYQNNVGSRDVHVYLGLLFCLSKTELQLNTITFCINSLSSLWLLFVVLHDKSEFR